MNQVMQTGRSPVPNRLRNLCFVLFLLAAVVLLVPVGLRVWKGIDWNKWVSAVHPYALGGIASLCLFLAYLARWGWWNTRRQWLVFAGRIVLLAVSVGLSIAGAESGIRGLFLRRQARNQIENLEKHRRGERIKVHGTHPLCSIIQASTNENMIYELQPNLSMDFGHRRLRTNRAGMRDSLDYPRERRPNSVRIVGVGDSGIFGWNVHQDEDYLAVLESNLNARADGVLHEVLNMGVPGYNTSQEVEMLLDRGLAFRPDIVVIGWCNNDFDIPFCVVQRENFARRDVSFLHLLLFDRPKLRDVCSVGVSDHRVFVKDRVPRNVLELSGVEGAKYSLRRAIAAAREEKFHLLLFGALNRQIIDMCRELGIEYYDICARIPADKYPKEYAVHFFHPRPEGHRVLAEHLEAYLRDRGWLAVADTAR